MKARVAGIAGSVLALTVIGGFAAASTFQSVAPAAVVQPAAVVTVAPVVVPTTQAPVVAAPAPVVSTQAPVVVAPKPKVVTVPKAVAPAPKAAEGSPVAPSAVNDGVNKKKGTGGSPEGGIIGDPRATPTPSS